MLDRRGGDSRRLGRGARFGHRIGRGHLLGRGALIRGRAEEDQNRDKRQDQHAHHHRQAARIQAAQPGEGEFTFVVARRLGGTQGARIAGAVMHRLGAGRQGAWGRRGLDLAVADHPGHRGRGCDAAGVSPGRFGFFRIGSCTRRGCHDMGHDAADDDRRGPCHGGHHGFWVSHDRIRDAGLGQIGLAEGRAGEAFRGKTAGSEIGLAVEAVVIRTRHEARWAKALGAGEILGLFQGAAGDGGHAQRLDVAIGRGAPVIGQVRGRIGRHRLKRAGHGGGCVRSHRNGQRGIQDLVVGDDQNGVQIARLDPRLLAQRGKPGGHFPAREGGFAKRLPAEPVAAFKQDRLGREAHGEIGRGDGSVHDGSLLDDDRVF